MLDNNIREQIISLINREVVPAVGCTEPMCVSLCVHVPQNSWDAARRR